MQDIFNIQSGKRIVYGLSELPLSCETTTEWSHVCLGILCIICHVYVGVGKE